MPLFGNKENKTSKTDVQKRIPSSITTINRIGGTGKETVTTTITTMKNGVITEKSVTQRERTYSVGDVPLLTEFKIPETSWNIGADSNRWHAGSPTFHTVSAAKKSFLESSYPKPVAAAVKPAPKSYTPVYPRNKYFETGTSPLSSTPLPNNTVKTFSTATPTKVEFLRNGPSIARTTYEPPQSNFIDDLSKLLEVRVKKTKTFYDKDCKVPTYITSGKQRGKMLLINNVIFAEKKDMKRKGAELDELNIERLFKQIGFDVKKHRNLKRQEMIERLKSYRDSTSLKNVDISVVVMMSHGYGNRNGSTEIAGTDEQLLETSDIIDMFNNVNCSALRGKPKIFIFQCCRGENKQIETDSAPYSEGSVKKEISDMLLAYSTIPGYVSHRDPTLGTWYIQTICKVFMEHAHDTHVEDLLKIVESKLSELAGDSKYTQTTSYENRGFKTCYLHPK